MGQNNQGQNLNQQPSSSCCLSRRYVEQKKMQKQNKSHQKIQKSACMNPNELQIYSKERFRDQIPSKSSQRQHFQSNNHLTPQQQKKTKQITLRIEEIVNLGLESQIGHPNKIDFLTKQFDHCKMQVLQLPDICEQIERISTRENSLSSNNLSNNSITTNNEKLKNKIKNLKMKYCSIEQAHKPSPIQQSKIQQSFINQQLKQFKTSKSIHKNPNKMDFVQNKKTLQQTKKNLQSQEIQIQFFSENSQSDDDENYSGNANRQNDVSVNEEMMNSQKIETMIHQFKINKKMNKIKNYQTNLQKIPQESQKIHSSKSEEQLSNHLHKKNSHPSPKPQSKENDQQTSSKGEQKPKVTILTKYNSRSHKSQRDSIHESIEGNRFRSQKILDLENQKIEKRGHTQNVFPERQNKNQTKQRKSRQNLPQQSKKIMVF